MLHRTFSKHGHSGFEELKNFIKDGSDFAKQIAEIIQERSELEAAYSKGVSKLATKLFKASKENVGTVSNAWHFIANDFEQTAEIHKLIATSMLEEIAKPLKTFGDIQHRTRKTTEALVEKRHKQLQDWRATEAKAKSKSYTACRENEKCQDQLLDCKLGRGKVLSEKEHLKLQAKRKKSESAVRKCDMEYYAAAIKSERSRLEWESSVKRGVGVLSRLEEERLSQLGSLSRLFLSLMQTNRPKLISLTERLREPVDLCDVVRDIEAINKYVADPAGDMGVQVLPHFYAEDLVNIMNKERRREALAKFVGILKGDIDREKKGRAGVENLAKALQETPKFGGEESQQDVQEKLQHMRSMMTFLEASRFKALNVMMDLESRPRVSHPLASYIDYSKDKQGLTAAALKIPAWYQTSSLTSSLPPTPQIDLPPLPAQLDWTDRGTADGGSPDSRKSSPHIKTSLALGLAEETSPVFTTINPIMCSPESDSDTSHLLYRGRGDGRVGESDDDSVLKSHDESDIINTTDISNVTVEDSNNLPDSDFDDFDSNDDEEEEEEHSGEIHGSQDNEIHEIYYVQESKQTKIIGQCRAIYDYTANMYDELSIKTGDIINVHHKQEDGWWVGECDNTTGIFPATYVENI